MFGWFAWFVVVVFGGNEGEVVAVIALGDCVVDWIVSWDVV